MRYGQKMDDGGDPGGCRPRSGSVMIVEDEFIIALALRRQVEALGCTVCCVTDTMESALNFAQSGTAEVVLMDVAIRGDCDGIEAARRLVTEHGLPVIVVSAYTDSETRQRVSLAGASAMLGKPAAEQELCDALAFVLGAVE